MIRRPPRSTRTYTLFPYTTLFRSVDLDGRLLLGEGWRHGGLSPDRALRLSPLRRCRALAARNRRQELGHAAEQAADDGRDHVRHGRTRRAADGPQEGRLLVRLAPDHRGKPQAGAARSEERRVGKGCCSTGRSWWAPDH